VPVVGPGFNFPTANSVADDFSMPQLTNALGQGIGGLVLVANLTGPNCGPNNAPTTSTIDTAWHSFCLYRPDVACEAANGDQLSDRAKVTPEDYKSIAQGVIASFGTIRFGRGSEPQTTSTLASGPTLRS
jgi:hypothetical protein